MSLDEVRARIDDIDTDIVKLLAARQKLVHEAARYKGDKQAVRAPERRAAMMRQRQQIAYREGVAPEVVQRVFLAMIDGIRRPRASPASVVKMIDGSLSRR